MITEHASLQSPTSIVRIGTPYLTRPLIIAQRVRTLTHSLLGAIAAYGNPSFFDFERQGPVHHSLGGGVSRVSDSFWPISERWM